MPEISHFEHQARDLDKADPLREFRKEFSWPEDDLLYLDGNSLGPLPQETATLLSRCTEEEWGRGLIRSWNKGWYDLPVHTGDELAPLIGARAGEVCFADSVTVNLFKLVSAAIRLKRGRARIVTDSLNFPSDFYALQGLSGKAGEGVEVCTVESANGVTVETQDLVDSIDENTILVTISHVVFKSGFMHDLKTLAEAAHAARALILVDLSHSVGSVPIQVEEWGVDMAVGCSYKYLNGGPGAPAFLYVRKNLQDKLEPLLQGWFGTEDPFAFNAEYRPAAGIRRFLVGSPPILSLRAVGPGIRLLKNAGMQAIREKSLRQTRMLIALYDAFLSSIGFKLGSPREDHLRGSHISFQHEEAFRINKALIHPPPGKPVVIPDFRRPDNLRLGVAPLYTRYSDLLRAVERIREIVKDKEYERFGNTAETVT